jgi:hypothetical protein
MVRRRTDYVIVVSGSDNSGNNNSNRRLPDSPVAIVDCEQAAAFCKQKTVDLEWGGVSECGGVPERERERREEVREIGIVWSVSNKRTVWS